MASDGFEAGPRLMLVALAAFSAAWVTAVGAAVGSFLNVVVYRLPRGMSLVRPKSRCPACGTPIRPGDNLPVIGWLRLRGRCRACGGRIAARYPLVEAATAVLFLGLAHFELFSGGANLPGGPERADGLSFVLWQVRPALVGAYLYHVVLLTTLLCLGLIVWDGFPPPRTLTAVSLTVGLTVPLFVPARPVAAGAAASWLSAGWVSVGQVGGISVGLYPAALLDGLVGLGVGVVVGAAVCLAARRGAAGVADRRATVLAGGLVGLFLGWQAAVSCGLGGAVLAVGGAVLSRFARRPLPAVAVLAAAASVQVLFWREVAASAWWPNWNGWSVLKRVAWPEPGFTASSLAAATVVAGLVAWVAGGIGRGAAEEATLADGGDDVPPDAEKKRG